MVDGLGPVRTGLVVIGGFVLTVCGLLAGYAVLSRGIDEGVLIATGVAGLFVVMLPMVVTGKFSVVEPIVYVMGIVMIGFTFKTVYVVFADTARAEELIRFGRSPSFFLSGAFWTLIGLMSLSAGYVMTRQRVALERLPAFQSDTWAPNRVWIATLLLAVVGLVSAVLYVRLMGIQFTDLNSVSSKRYYDIEGADTNYGTLGYVVWGARFTEYAAYVLYTWLASRGERLWSWRGALLGTLVAAAIVIPFISNSRQSAALVLLNLLILSMLLRGRINARATVVTLVIIVMGFATLTSLRRNEADAIQNSLMSSSLVEEIAGSRHFNDFTRTSHVLAAVPERMPYKYGSTLVGWIIAPIPRVLWKDKPFLGIGKEVAEKVFGYTDRRGVPPGFLAEIAINFSVWAIPLFMFLAGAALKVLYLSFEPILSTKKGALLYVMVVYPATFSLLNNEITVMMTRAIVTSIPFVMLFLFFRRRKPRRVRRFQPARLAYR